MLRYSFARLCSVAGLMLLLNGCATTNQTTLYQQLGEKPGISKLVEDLINEVLNDNKISQHFEEADLDRTHDKLVEQICQLSDGPCEYTGKTMQEMHKDMIITKGHFNAIVEALMRAMDHNNIAVGAQNQLLSLLAPMHQDIITKH